MSEVRYLITLPEIRGLVNGITAFIWGVSRSKVGTKPGNYDWTYIFFFIAFKHVGIVPKVGLDRFIPLHFSVHYSVMILPLDDT